MQPNRLKIIITGGASGMGAHFARKLYEAGAQVAVGDVNEAMMSELPAEIHRRALDVSNEANVIDFVSWANDKMGGLNGLVNNAGILRDGLLVKKDRTTGKVLKLSREDWDSVLAVNLTGATMMVREDDEGHEPEGARGAGDPRSGGPDRPAGGHLARRSVRPRVRLLQWPHDRCRWRPVDVVRLRLCPRGFDPLSRVDTAQLIGLPHA